MTCQYAMNCPPPAPRGHIGTAVSIGPFDLPMTGFDLVSYVALAIAIVAFGLMLRLSTREPDAEPREPGGRIIPPSDGSVR